MSGCSPPHHDPAFPTLSLSLSLLGWLLGERRPGGHLAPDAPTPALGSRSWLCLSAIRRALSGSSHGDPARGAGGGCPGKEEGSLTEQAPKFLGVVVKAQLGMRLRGPRAVWRPGSQPFAAVQWSPPYQDCFSVKVPPAWKAGAAPSEFLPPLTPPIVGTGQEGQGRRRSEAYATAFTGRLVCAGLTAAGAGRTESCPGWGYAGETSKRARSRGSYL